MIFITFFFVFNNLTLMIGSLLDRKLQERVTRLTTKKYIQTNIKQANWIVSETMIDRNLSMREKKTRWKAIEVHFMNFN